MILFSYVYFTGYNGNVDFVWNDFENKFHLSDSIDFTDCHKFECNTISETVKEVFEKEQCFCDGKGLQLGFYEFTFDIYFQDSNHSENKGFAESFDYCLNYVKSNPQYFKGSFVQIVCRETEEIVWENGNA